MEFYLENILIEIRNSQGNTWYVRVSHLIFFPSAITGPAKQPLWGKTLRISTTGHSALKQYLALWTVKPFAPPSLAEEKAAITDWVWWLRVDDCEHKGLAQFHTTGLSHAEFEALDPPLISSSFFFFPTSECDPFWINIKYQTQRPFIRRQFGLDQCFLDFGMSQISKTVETKFKDG